LLALALIACLFVYAGVRLRLKFATPGSSPPTESRLYEATRVFPFQRFGLVWGSGAADTAAHPRDYSNINPEDYVGAEACGRCHKEKFQSWSGHPHRWMNAAATPERVRGDFTGRTLFRYLGGEGRFWREGDQFWMSAKRNEVQRQFRVTRTIGSRYFQYYVGVQTAGPEPADDPRYKVDHVLPFGYWLTKKEWVPTVHISDDRSERGDDTKVNPYEGFAFTDYDRSCSQCHTTLPMGDWLLRNPDVAGVYTPYPFTLALSDYLRREGRAELAETPERVSSEAVNDILRELVENRLPARILHLGIECEACHNGGKRHAADPMHTPPHFFPTGPLIKAQLPRDDPYGRTHDNLNWICARCHNGGRPLFPGGISTWNSVEFTDAMRGSCYSQLRCVDCHDPHQATGPAWAQSPDDDDRLCLRCHEPYRDSRARQQHTHHTPGSEGNRCMNCHMPRINEGLDQLVRTHTIFSPTKREPIEQNGPNACNLCHLERPIDWTLKYLGDWYGKHYFYDEKRIAQNYPERTAPVGEGWLRHSFQATRLVAAATYGRQKRVDSLPVLVEILDDKFLLNRQFGQMAVEAVCKQSLAKWGYHFTLAPAERAPILPRLRAALFAPKR
jgi:predicted CXXCH cytochrome family protein